MNLIIFVLYSTANPKLILYYKYDVVILIILKNKLRSTNITILFAILLLAVMSLIIGSYTNSLVFAQDTSNSSQQSSSPIPSIPSTSLPPPPPFFNQLSPQQTASSTNKTCTLTPSLIEVEGTPQQTEGPYFVEGMPNRSDIRSDVSDDSIREGIPLHLILNVYTVNVTSNNNTISCIPLSDAKVDIWYANSLGLYSGVQQDGTQEKTFLRGYQITNDNGTVNFDSIYPGWYEGRAMHIHIKVSTFDGPAKKSEWTSQFYLNNSINEQVHKQVPYSQHGLPPLKNEDDGIFNGPSTDGLVKNNTGQHLMLNVTKADKRYVGTFNVVVNASDSSK